MTSSKKKPQSRPASLVAARGSPPLRRLVAREAVRERLHTSDDRFAPPPAEESGVAQSLRVRAFPAPHAARGVPRPLPLCSGSTRSGCSSFADSFTKARSRSTWPRSRGCARGGLRVEPQRACSPGRRPPAGWAGFTFRPLRGARDQGRVPEVKDRGRLEPWGPPAWPARPRAGGAGVSELSVDGGGD